MGLHMTTVTISTALTNLLARLAARRKSIDHRSALRFASLSTDCELENPMATEGPSTAELPRATLSITSGLHRGAAIVLTNREYVIGSGDDCDIVLRDGTLARRHCRLIRAWSGFSLQDLRTENPQPIVPQSVNYPGAEIEAVYDIGGVSVTLLHTDAADSAEPGTQVKRYSSWVLCTALSAGLLLSIIVFAATNRGVAHATPSLAERIVAGNQALAGQRFDSVHFHQGSHDALEITGLVRDRRDDARLREWLAHGQYNDAHIAVQPVSELIDQVQHTFAGENLQVGLHDGRLRIAGTTQQMSVKERIRSLGDDLHSVITVEDGVAYVDARQRSLNPGPLPVKLRGVMVGDPSYFLTDSGARYFVGGVLPDGAEVLSIEATRIRFRLGGAIVVYNLE